MIAENRRLLALVIAVELGDIVDLYIVFDPISKTREISVHSQYADSKSYARCPAGLYPLYSPFSRSEALWYLSFSSRGSA